MKINQASAKVNTPHNYPTPQRTDQLMDLRDPGFFIIDDEVIDEYGATIGPLGVAVYNVLVKHANKNGSSCFPSYQTIATKLGISRNSAIKGVELLIGEGLVKKDPRTDKSGAPTSNNYKILNVKKKSKATSPEVVQNLHQPVNLSDAGSAEFALPLVQDLHQGSANSAPEPDPSNQTPSNQTHTQHLRAVGAPAVAVCVNSKFSLKDCRRYAKHLQSTGQGINNPGGYATTIQRSGEADELIATWLAEVEPQRVQSGELPSPTRVDTSNCPDCSGRSLYYPDPSNPGKGAKKCSHERLTQAKTA
jgi:predicted transcriptional regulator